MRCARQPAPNPLSIFMTPTPAAQEFSMVNSAASPLKLAPYPRLVGTATTGHSTRPPTTLGKTPSIPATTTMTWASVSCLMPAQQAMNTRDAYVVERLNAAAHDFRRNTGFLGDQGHRTFQP